MTNKCIVNRWKTGHKRKKRKKRKGEMAEDDTDEATMKEKKINVPLSIW